MSKQGQAERAAWGGFPKVIRNGDLGDLKKQPEYEAAKQGDMEAGRATEAAAGPQSVAVDGLYEDAQGLEREQQALLEAAPVEQSYQESLAGYVLAKHDQVERIEDRLEKLIEKQQTKIQQTQAGQPGLFSRSSTKTAWQSQQMQQQARLQTLHSRLEAVREIKDGMGIHTPRIEEMATRKLRAKEPGLAADFDEMQEAQRRHQALLRKQEQERKQKLQQEQQQHLGRGQRLGLNQTRG